MLNELRRWVDPRITSVRVADLRAYLLHRGWTSRTSPRPQQLAFEEPSANLSAPLTISCPASEGFADYPQRILEVITELAEIEDRYAGDVLNEILKFQEPSKANGTASERTVGTEVSHS